jgi:hypothetical protein
MGGLGPTSSLNALFNPPLLVNRTSVFPTLKLYGTAALFVFDALWLLAVSTSGTHEAGGH